MNLFNEKLVLKNMEEILLNYLHNTRIISDIPLTHADFEYLAKKVRIFIENGAELELFSKYKACIAVFLVFGAVYYYEGGTYWPHIEKYIGNIQTNKKKDFYNRFLYILKEMNLRKFEKEQKEGFKFVTPIVCHAGIPQACLDDYFELVRDTINDTMFLEGHVLDEFKYLMRYKVQKPVIRYFDYLEDEALSFLENTRSLVLYSNEDNASPEEALLKFSNLPKRIVIKCFEWLSSDKVKEKIKTRKNVYITSPKINIDSHGMGIYVLLPQQIVKESFDDSISWEIACGEKLNIIKSKLFRKGNSFVSEEKVAVLMPSENYRITMFLEDKPIGTWEFDELSNGYLSFDSKGGLIRKNYLPPDIVTIVCFKNDNLGSTMALAEELPSIPNWNKYKIFRLNLENVNKLTCSFGTLIVKKNTRPTLIGGMNLFDQTDGVGGTCYTQLPIIYFNDTKENWYLSIVQKYEKENISSMKTVIPQGIENFNLSDVIERNNYGEYEITVWNSRDNHSRFQIKYVPEVQFYYEKTAYWPSKNKGYENSDFYCRFSQGISLEFENATCVGTVLINGKDYIKYLFNSSGRYLYGDLSFATNDKLYKIPVRKSIRPIMWGFLGMGLDTSINWDSKPKTFSLKEFQDNTDANLIISFDGINKLNIKANVILLTNNLKKLTIKTFDVTNTGNYRIPMNFFLTDILTADENSFSLVLEINDLEGQKICECLIARIQDNLVYSEFNIKIENNLAYFNWHEQGAKIDRELVLYNCCMPWDEPYTFPINDEVCDYYLDISILENSMYAAKLRYIDDFDFFDSEIDIPYISDIKLFKAGTKYKELSKLKSLLTAIFKNVFTNEKLDNIEKMINNLEPEICKENIEVICISYLYFIKNTRKNDTYKQLIKVFNKIIYLYSENKPLILKTLLNMNISEKDFKRLSLVFSLFSLKPDNKTTFSPVERNLLWNFLPELAFILDIQTKQDPGRICNWVSDNVISQMLNIKPECSIRSCLQKNINAECKCDKVSFNLSKDIFGSTKHINGFFEFLNKDFSSARRLNKYTNVELLKKYEQQAENTEVRIMGKSYFSTVQDWKTSTDKKKCEKFNSILEKVIKKSDVIKVVENNYPLVIKTLRERYDTTPSIEYYIGIFIFINCLSRRDLLKLSTNEERIISHIYKRFRALFVRDLIAFELYLLYGGMNYGS